MEKLAAGARLVVASHNPGKVWEIGQLLAPYGLDAVSAADLNLGEPEETATTFAGNAQLKAVAAAVGSGLPALADDSGLEIDCLDGAPGIYSARWAGPGKDFGVAMRKVAEEITARKGWETPPRANFISVLCLAWPSGEMRLFEGRVFGHLVWPARGGNGFGYDPMFVADGAAETFGEMEPAAKYAISHRTRAFALFKSEMLDQIAPNGDARPVAQQDKSAFFAAAASLSTRPELAAFVDRLRADLEANGGDWGNANLDDFLAALGRELAADEQSTQPAWRQLAHALLVASAKP